MGGARLRDELAFVGVSGAVRGPGGTTVTAVGLGRGTSRSPGRAGIAPDGRRNAGNHRNGRLDSRWVKIQRPEIVVGGELTMPSLDLIYDPVSKTYEAPFQMKANMGLFVIDDFGRQTMRPQNLPQIQKLFAPWSYFIDTTYAVGPRECSDAAHPIGRNDDIAWKIRLSDEARRLFGIFGSECGREWALPHSEFIEGLVGVRGKY